MEFLKYPSLTNHYAIAASRSLLTELKNTDRKWYATEKLDGTNIGLHINMITKEAHIGNRVGFADDMAPYSDVPNHFEPGFVESIIEFYAKNAPEAQNIHVFGELYGSGIQKNQYSITAEKKRAIVWFDIFTDENTEKFTERPLNELLTVIPESQQPHIIFDNTSIKDALEIKPYDESVYGGGSEGYVLKPQEGQVYIPGFKSYSVIKYKTDAFSEKRHNRVKANNKIKSFSDPVLAVKVLDYVTENRLSNIISHGEIKPIFKNFGLLAKAMENDIVTEFTRENPEYDADSTRSAIQFQKHEVSDVVRNYLKTNFIEDKEI